MHLKEEIQTELIISNALWDELIYSHELHSILPLPLPFTFFSFILPVHFLIILDCWIDCFNVVYLKLTDLAESLELFIEMLYGELL